MAAAAEEVDLGPAKPVDIHVGSVNRSALRHVVEAVTTEKMVFKEKDGEKAKSTKTLQLSVHHGANLSGDVTLWPDSMRLNGDEFGVDTVSGMLDDFTGIIVQCASDDGTRMLGAAIVAEVNGLEPGASSTIKLDGHEVRSALAATKPGVLICITDCKVYFTFCSDAGDTSKVTETTSLALYDAAEPIDFAECIISGAFEGPTPLGVGMWFDGALFYSTFLQRHATGEGTKTFTATLRSLGDLRTFTLTTKVNELQTRDTSIEARAVEGGDHLKFTLMDTDAVPEVEDPDDVDQVFAVPRPTKKRRVLKVRDVFADHKVEWEASMDLGKVFQALKPVQEQIAAVWVVPFREFFVFVVPLDDGSVVGLTTALSVTEAD